MTRDIEAIAEAIAKRRIIEFWYEPGLRNIEPHCLGKSANGDFLLRAYQTGGASSSGEHEHWKLFRIDRCSSVKIMDESFNGPRPEYKRGDRAMKRGIISEL